MQKYHVLLLLIMCLAACKKEDNPSTELPVYKGPVMVNFNNYLGEDDYWGYLKHDVELVNQWLDVSVEVKLSNTTRPADAPVTVKIIKSDVNIYDYNTATGHSLLPVPLPALKMEQTEVVIPKGGRSATYTFKVNPGLLNLNNQYALGLAIAEVAGANAVVNGDPKQSRVVVELGTLNQYDGIYKMSNYFFHPTNPALTGIQNYEPVHMITSGANSVDSYVNTSTGLFPSQLVFSTATGAGNLFTGVNPRFVINSTSNLVTLEKAGPASVDFLQNATEAAASKYYASGITGYSAGKKTIVAHFRWQSGGAGTDRVCRDTFVYVSSR